MHKHKVLTRAILITLLLAAFAILTIIPVAAQQPAPEAVPGVIAQSGPTGTITINPAINFTWPRDANASWYELVIVNEAGAIIYDQWLSLEQTCVASLCTFDGALLTNGAYTWYMRAWGLGGMGPWNNGQAFSLNFTAPAYVPLDMPHTYVNGMVNVRWARDLNASWYEIFVAGPDGYIYHEWQEGASTCYYNRCYAPQELTPGDYDVWIRGWGPGGTGAWNATEYEFVVY